jgi:DNA polymerase II small subunit/DNA polymerase delta subunit B
VKQEASREVSGEQLVTGKAKQEATEESDAKTHENQKKVSLMKQDIVNKITSTSTLKADVTKMKANLRSRVDKLNQSRDPKFSRRQIEHMEHNIMLLERRIIELGGIPTPTRMRRRKKI